MTHVEPISAKTATPISKELREFLNYWMKKKSGRLCNGSYNWCKRRGFDNKYQLWDELEDLFRAQFDKYFERPFDLGTPEENNQRRIDWVVKTLAE